MTGASNEPTPGGPGTTPIQRGSVRLGAVLMLDEEVTALLEESRSRGEAAGKVRK